MATQNETFGKLLSLKDFMMKKAKPLPPAKSIPITKGLESTVEELQLKEDEAMADYRDFCMYARIINGIMIGRQGQSNVETLHNIIRTRHLPVQALLSSSYKDDFDKYTISSSGTTALSDSIISPDELLSYAAVAKDDIQVIITDRSEEGESREEDSIFVLDL
jgi:hypothetical protein